MKNYDKLLFVIALIACIPGVYLYTKSTETKTTIQASPTGKTIEPWKNTGATTTVAQAWKPVAIDTAEGWNYDLFTTPEITYLSKDKKYIAKELPPPPAESVDIKLISIINPPLRFRIASCSSEIPPTLVQDESGKTIPGKYRVLVTFENTLNKETTNINFSKISNVKSKTSTKNGRTIITLTPKAPIAIPGQNASLKSLTLVRGKSDSGDGTTYTRRFATVIDKNTDNANGIRITEETVYDNARTEALFQEEGSTAQWLYAIVETPGEKAPTTELFTRASPNEAFKKVEGTDTIKIGNATYSVKELDISAQEAIITKQSESNKKSRRNKVWQWTLTPKK